MVVGVNFGAADTIVRGNSISGRMAGGISFAGIEARATIPSAFPGHCSLDFARLCVDSTDCNLAGFDQTSKGSCVGMAPVTLNGNLIRLLAEGNSLAGTFDTAALFASSVEDFSFQSNFVEGGGATVSGIRLARNAINGTVEGNVVNGVGNALFLSGPAPETWTIRLRLNDFTGHLTAIRTTNNYNLLTDLAGNYWGLPGPGFDPDLVRYENGVVNPFIFCRD